jgi:hypothetical protein
MKVIFSLLMVAFSFTTSAQLLEGHVQYHIRIAAMDTTKETMQKVLMMQKSKMDVFFMEKKSRIDFDMGGMIYSCIVVDNTLPRALSLNKSPKGSFAAYLGKAELDEKRAKTDSTARVELVDETKEILGYTCRKAILYQNNEIAIYWCTNDIKVERTDHPLLNDLLPGFPLSFSMVKDGMKIEYTAASFEKVLEQKDHVFSLMVPEGYYLVTNGGKSK